MSSRVHRFPSFLGAIPTPPVLSPREIVHRGYDIQNNGEEGKESDGETTLSRILELTFENNPFFPASALAVSLGAPPASARRKLTRTPLAAQALGRESQVCSERGAGALR